MYTSIQFLWFWIFGVAHLDLIVVYSYKINASAGYPITSSICDIMKPWMNESKTDSFSLFGESIILLFQKKYKCLLDTHL